MPRTVSPMFSPETARFGILTALVFVCFIGGGASRHDVLSLIYVQPFAVVCFAALLLVPGQIDWRLIQTPLLLLGALGTIMVTQLIPLSPALWAALPGHAPFAEVAGGAGAGEVWRPISLTPDFTLASLAGLIVPATALIGFASIPRTWSYRLLSIILIGAALSIFVGLAQVAGGERSPFYIYAVTSPGIPVGLFSNRNHQALFLVITWVMLAVWASRVSDNPRADNVRRSIAVAFAMLIPPVLLITGSRAGLAIAPIGLLLAGLIWRAHRPESRLASKTRRMLMIGLAIGTVVIIGAAIALSRDEAIQRVLDTSFSNETRLDHFPILLNILRDFFPVGTGFGAFDPIYRSYEPDAMLSASYLNHAHNDLVELGITGGLPALLVALLFLIWFSRLAVAALRDRAASRRRAFAWLAAGMILLVMLSSLVDYPLRTPLMSVLFAFACGWLGQARCEERARAPST